MSRHVRYDRMSRRLKRAAEVACDPAISKCVERVHDDVLAPKATAFWLAHDAVGVAQSAVDRARRKVRQSEGALDGRYCLVRSVALAYDPDVNLPETLKAQKTDTDKLAAVTTLLSFVQSHAGEQWADELLADSFGTLAPKAKAALEECIAATKALWVAQRARANAFGPAHTAYQAFKRVVRDDMGSASLHYRRLHTRASAVEQAEAEEEAEQAEQAEQATPDSAVVPSVQGGSAATAGAPQPVKVA